VTSSVEAILFDAYGTLFDVTSVREVVAELIPNASAFVAGWRTRQLEYSWLRTAMGRYVDFERVSADALDATALSAGLELALADRERLLAAWLRPTPFPEVPAALAALGEVPLGILSNGSPAMLATVLEHTGLMDRFRWVLSVDAVRAYKPSPEVYRLGVTGTGFPPERILFVSSNGWDIAGAAAFGFETCWVNRSAAALERLGQEPGRTIHSLAQLPELLRTLLQTGT
jgi:2-haloacid dehalogenase